MNGATFIDFVERLRTKPEHIRHRIALGSAIGVSIVAAVVWVATFPMSSIFDLNSATSAVAANSGNQNAAPQTPFSQLLGAVGVTQATSSAPALTPVDTPDPNAPATIEAENANAEAQGTYTEPATTTDAGTGGDQTQIPF